jgi:hypothetical protein
MSDEPTGTGDEVANQDGANGNAQPYPIPLRESSGWGH